MYHVCLIPFCIIDMDLAVFFFKQLNNLLLCANSARPRCGQNASSHLVFFSFRGAQEARNLWRTSPALMELMWLKRGISFTWKSFVGGGWSEENMDSSWSRFTQAASTSRAAAFSLEGGEWSGVSPPPGTWRTFFKLYFWIFPQLLHNSCCRPNLLTGRFCLFFLLFLFLVWGPNSFLFFSWINLYNWYQ